MMNLIFKKEFCVLRNHIARSISRIKSLRTAISNHRQRKAFSPKGLITNRYVGLALATWWMLPLGPWLRPQRGIWHKGVGTPRGEDVEPGVCGVACSPMHSGPHNLLPGVL